MRRAKKQVLAVLLVIAMMIESFGANAVAYASEKAEAVESVEMQEPDPETAEATEESAVSEDTAEGISEDTQTDAEETISDEGQDGNDAVSDDAEDADPDNDAAADEEADQGSTEQGSTEEAGSEGQTGEIAAEEEPIEDEPAEGDPAEMNEDESSEDADQADTVGAEDAAADEITQNIQLEALETDDFQYTVSGSNATITGYTGTSTALVIPSQIGDYTVTAIGSSAFKGQSNVTSISLPETITSLGSTFIQGTGIKSLTVPKSVTSCGVSYSEGPLSGSVVEEVVFEDGTQKILNGFCETESYSSYIKKVTIPESVTEIGSNAFRKCKVLGSVNIPKAVKTIGESAFNGCTSLSEVKLNYNDAIVNTTSSGQQLYSLDIGNSAFYGCTSLEAVSLTGNVKSVGQSAFSGCTSLKSVGFNSGGETAQSSLTLGASVFYGCEALTDLSLPGNLTSIGSMFIQGTGIKSLTVPKSVTSCGSSYSNGPLAGSKVEEVIFEDGMTSIPAYFCATSSSYTSYISKVVIPDSVTSIGTNAFSGCDYVGLTIYGYPGSYAELYATEHSINFKYVSINKNATEDDILAMFHVKSFLKDISLGSLDDIEGPTISLNGKEFQLFKIDAAGLELSVTDHVQVSVDVESKTVKLLIGYKPIDEDVTLDPSESGSGGVGTAKRNKAFKKEFDDFKSLYRSIGLKGSDAQIKSKLRAINSKLYDSNATLGLSASGKVSGYMEISYASGEFYLKEGGVIVSAGLSAEYNRPLPQFPAAYVAFGVSVDFDGTMRFVKITQGYTPELAAELALMLKLGLGLGSHKAKTYVEGGLKGTLGVGLTYPADTLPKALKVNLSGDLYISSSLFGFEGPGYTHTFYSNQIYPKVGSDIITYSSNAALNEIDRSYLENETDNAALGELLDNGAELIYTDGRVYPYNDAQIVSLSDGTKLMVWVGDDGTKSGVNKTSIMYATYDGSAWSDVSILAETGGMNDYPVLYQNGDTVYVVWQKAVKAFADDVELQEVLQNIDIYYAVYENGEMSDAAAVTSDNTYEMMQQMAVDGDDLYAAWVENSDNDVYMTSGTSSVKLARRNAQGWAVETIYSGDSDVNNLAMNVIGGELTVVFEVGSLSGDEYVSNLYMYRKGSNRLLAENAQNTMIDKDIMYYIEDSMLKTYDVVTEKKHETGLTGINDYEVVSSGMLTYVVVNQSNGYTGELYAYTYNRQTGRWSESIQLTDFGKYIRSFSITADEYGSMTAALNLVTVNDTDDNSNRFGDAVLKVLKLGETPDLTVDSAATFDASAVKPGADVPILVHVTNNSLFAVNGLNVSLYDKNNIKVETKKIDAVIESGDTATIQYVYKLPANLSKHTIRLEVWADGEEKLDDNKASATIGIADLCVENAYLRGTAEAPLIEGVVHNIGYETAQNITVELVDGSDGETILATKTISSLSAGSSEKVSFALDSSYLDVNPLASGNTVDLTVSCETDEADYSNNTAQVLIRSAADAKITLNRESVEMKAGESDSLSVTYTGNAPVGSVVWSSSDAEVAGVDTTGKVVAYKAGSAVITAQMGSSKAACTVYVAETAATGIYLSINSLTLQEGENKSITASVYPAEAAGTVVWSSDDLTVATVSSDGTVTAVRGGKTVITARCGAVSAVCNVTVYGSGEPETDLKDISKCTVTVADQNIVYNGEAHEPEVTVRGLLLPLTPQVDYTVVYSDNIDAGTAKVTVVGIGEYTGTVEKTFEIKKAEQTLTASISSSKLKAGDSAYITAEGIGEISYESSNEDVAIVSSKGRVAAFENGKATITVTAAGDVNHNPATVKIEIEVTEEAAGSDIADCTIELQDQAFVYDGTEKKAQVVVKSGSTVLIERKDYDLAYSDNINAGTAKVVVSGTGTYTGTVEKTYTIAKAEQKLAVMITATQELTADSFAVVTTGKTQKYTAAGAQGALSCLIADPSLASALVTDASITLTGEKAGFTRMTVKAAETDNYLAAEAEFELRVLPGKTTRGDMFNLANNVKVTWKEVPGAAYYKVYRQGVTDSKESLDEPVIVTTGLVGWDKSPGLTNGHAYRYKIVASLTGKDAAGKSDPSGDSPLSYSKLMYRLKTVVIRSVKNTAPGKVTVKYDKTATGDSYVLQYCERQDMVGAKTKVVLGASNTSYVIGGLKKGKTYYISIRVRKKVGGIDYYTTFGVAKKIKIVK